MLKQLHLKSLFLLMLLLVGSGSAWAAEETMTFSERGFTNGQSVGDEPINGSNFSVAFNKGSNSNAPKYYDTGAAVRAYGGNYFTVSSSATITKIVLAFASGEGSNAITTDVETYKDGTWEGNAKAVKFTIGGTSGHRRIVSIAVTTESGSVQPTDAALSSIALSGDYPTIFTEGDEFSHDGMIVKATYDDESTKDNVVDLASFSGYDMNTPGNQTVTVSYTEGEVSVTAEYTITVNAVPTHTVAWSVNGTVRTETYKEGAAIAFPANSDDVEGKVFQGWTATAIEGTTDEKPAFVTAATMGESDLTFYAVFATVEESSASVVDEITYSGVDVSGTTYQNWNKTFTSGVEYVGNSAGGNNAIQLRSNNNNSGIVSTTTVGKISKIAVKWNSETSAGRKINVYGSKTAYTNPSDLYSADTQGKLIDNLTKGESKTELTIDGDYAYIGIRSAGNALYLDKITITWGGTSTISAYCTTVAADTRAEAGISFAEATVTKAMKDHYTGQALTNPNSVSPISWASSNEEVATFIDGILTVKAAGETTIKASFAGDETYKGAEVSYTLTITPAVLESIALSGEYETVFAEGAEFSHEGVVVTANYDDTTTKDVTAEATFSGPDMAQTGEQTITVTYNEQTVTYTITVNAVPTHNVTWSVNGETTVASVKEGAAISFPVNPGAIEEKSFVGWVADAIDGTTDEAPEFITSATMGSEDITYYAVFASGTAGVGDVVDVLDNSIFGQDTGSYDSWEGKKASSNAIFAGNSMTPSNYNDDRTVIQLRSDNISGIVSTQSGGKLSKVVIEWNTSTNAARKLNVYGKNSAYSSAADLYDNSKQGTLLGTIDINGTEVVVPNDDNYEFVGVRSESGALYLNNISISWRGAAVSAYSDYCTTVSADTRKEAGISFAKATVTKEIVDNYTGQTLNNPNGVSSIEWTSSDENVATVEDGIVTVKAVGETTITASFAGNETYKKGTASYTLTIQDSRSALELSFSPASVEVDKDNTVDIPTLNGNQGNGAVTYQSADETIAIIEDGKVKGLKDGVTTITATVAATSEYQGGNAQFTVTVIDPDKKGTATNPYTVAEAIDLIDGLDGATSDDVHVMGVISQIDSYNSSYNSITYWICDAGNSASKLQVFSGKGLDNADFTSESDLSVGDEVVVLGQLKNYRGTPEFNFGNYIVSLNTKEAAALAYETTTFTTSSGDKTFVAPTLINPNNLTVTYASDNVEVASVNETTGEVTIGNVDGTATITASFAGNDAYKAGSATYTITVVGNKLDAELAVVNTSLNAGTEKAVTELYTTVSDGTVTFVSSNEDIAEVVDGNLMANGLGEATITVSVAGTDDYEAASKSFTVNVTVYPAVAPFDPTVTGGFTKVTSTKEIVNADYLIVNEEFGVAFDGSLETLDNTDDVIEVTISDNKIEETEDTKAAVFTIDVANGTLKSASGQYIGVSSNSNGLKTTEDAETYSNTFAIDVDGNAVISAAFESSTMSLLYNKASNQNRFRYYKNAGQEAIQLYRLTSASLTIGAAGWRTLVASENVQFPRDLKAYIIKEAGAEAVLTQVSAVKAGVPVLVKGAPGSYQLTVVDDEACADATGNLLQVSEENTTNAYVLANKESGVGFYQWTGGWMGAGRVYLPVVDGSAARAFIGFVEAITTSISSHRMVPDNGAVYNLKGQRVTVPGRGLYIVNGKKVVIK